MLKYLYIMGKAKMQEKFGNERGQGLTEYGVILAIVVIVAAGLAASSGENAFGSKLTEIYTNITTKLGLISSDLNK